MFFSVRVTDGAKRYRFALVVEDDPRVRRGLVREVGCHARTVVAVGDVAGAIVALAWKPDLITLDLALPDGRGHEVVEALREHSFSPFVIVISGTGSAKEAFALRALGVAVSDPPISVTIPPLVERPDSCSRGSPS